MLNLSPNKRSEPAVLPMYFIRVSQSTLHVTFDPSFHSISLWMHDLGRHYYIVNWSAINGLWMLGNVCKRGCLTWNCEYNVSCSVSWMTLFPLMRFGWGSGNTLWLGDAFPCQSRSIFFPVVPGNVGQRGHRGALMEVLFSKSLWKEGGFFFLHHLLDCWLIQWLSM